MARPLRFLRRLCSELAVPLVIAGDLFDTWREPAETIAFAMRELPETVYAVPGQHDLPYHRYDLMDRSAYGVLVESKRIVNLEPGKPLEHHGKGTSVCLHGFPWGTDLAPNLQTAHLLLDLAVVHRYIWSGLLKHPEAEEDQNVERVPELLRGYDAAAFGDNHLPFVRSFATLYVMNCGSLMRRNADQVDFVPEVGLLCSDNLIRRLPVPCDADRFSDLRRTAEVIAPGNFEKVIEELRHLGEAGARFEAAVESLLAGHPAEVREVVLEWIDDGR